MFSTGFLVGSIFFLAQGETIEQIVDHYGDYFDATDPEWSDQLTGIDFPLIPENARDVVMRVIDAETESIAESDSEYFSGIAVSHSYRLRENQGFIVAAEFAVIDDRISSAGYTFYFYPDGRLYRDVRFEW